MIEYPYRSVSMNGSALFQVVVNVLGTFVAGYGASVAAGLPAKVAIGAGVVAVVSNQTGLHQVKP